MALVVGLMSGTSMDGIDACLVEISSPSQHAGDVHDLKYNSSTLQLKYTFFNSQIYFSLKLVKFLTKPYPPDVRDGLIRLSSGDREGGTVADVSQYNFLLGQLFAEAAQEVVALAKRSMSDVTVIGSHGWEVM